MTELPKTRHSLLLELGNRTNDAWKTFLAIYEDALFRFCISRGLQEADAKDVVQQVLEAVLNRLPTWDADNAKGSFRGWLFRVARNIAVDCVSDRARKIQPSGETRVVQMLNDIPSPYAEDTSFDMEYRKSLFEWAAQQVKSEVKELTWKSFCQTALEGQKADVVAAALGIPVGNVYTSKCRVLARIKNKIAEFDPDANSPNE